MVACIDKLPLATQAIQGYLKDLQMSNVLQQCFSTQQCIHGLIFPSVFSVEGSRKEEKPSELSLQTCVLHAMDSTGTVEDKQNHSLNISANSPMWFLFTCVETV